MSDEKKLQLEFEFIYDGSGEEEAKSGIDNIAKAVRDLKKEAKSVSKDLTDLVDTKDKKSATKEQVDKISTSLDDVSGKADTVKGKVKEVIEAPAKSTKSSDLSNMTKALESVESKAKDATEATKKMAAAQKELSKPKQSYTLSDRDRKELDKEAAPLLETQKKVDAFVEAISKGEKSFDELIGKVSDASPVDNFVEKISDGMESVVEGATKGEKAFTLLVNKTVTYSEELEYINKHGMNAAAGIDKLAVSQDELNDIAEEWNKKTREYLGLMAESDINKLMDEAVAGEKDMHALAEAGVVFAEELVHINEKGMSASESMEDLSGLTEYFESIVGKLNKSVGQTNVLYEENVKRLNAASEATKDLTEEETELQKLYAETISRGPLDLTGMEHIPKNSPAAGDDAKTYNEKLELIKENIEIMNKEIAVFDQRQKASLDVVAALKEEAMAMEDGTAKIRALSDVRQMEQEITRDGVAAKKQLTLASRDYMLGIIARTKAQDEDVESQEKMKDLIRELETHYSTATGNMESFTNMVSRQAAETSNLSRKTRQQIQVNKELEAAERKVEAARKAQWAAINKMTNQMSGMFMTLSQAAQRFGRSFTRYVTTPILGAGIAAAKFTADMEVNLKSIEILLYNNAEEAKQLYDQVVAYSASTPYEIPDLTEATKQLLAYGTASKNVMGEIRMLGDLAQNDAKKLESITQAFGRAQARGAIHMRELNRFIMAGVPIMQALADVTDTSMSNIVESVRAGTVSFNTVKAAMRALTEEGGRYHNMSEKLAYTIKGRWATMNDEVNLMLRSFVEDFMPTIMKAINAVIEYSQALRNMSKSEKAVILDTIKMAAVIGPALLAVSAITNATAVFAKVAGGLVTVLEAVNKALVFMKIAQQMASPGVLTFISYMLTLGAAAIGVTKGIKGVKSSYDLITGAAEDRRETTSEDAEVKKALSVLYQDKSKMSGATYDVVRGRFPNISEDVIESTILSYEEESAFNILDRADIKMGNILKERTGALKAAEDLVREAMSHLTDEEQVTFESYLGRTRYIDLPGNREGLPYRKATDDENLALALESYQRYHYAPGITQRDGTITPGKITPSYNLESPKKVAKHLASFWDTFEDEVEAMLGVTHFESALQVMQQQYLNSIQVAGEKTGEGVAALVRVHVETTSEADPLDQLRRYRAILSDRLDEETIGIISDAIEAGDRTEAAISAAGFEETSIGARIVRELFKLSPKEAILELGEIDTFYKNISDALTEGIEGLTEAQELEYQKTNLLESLFPDRHQTAEAQKKFAEHMAGTYEDISRSLIAGYMERGKTLAEATEKLGEEHSDLIDKLRIELGRIESFEILGNIEKEVEGAIAAFEAIDHDPVKNFTNRMIAALKPLKDTLDPKEYASYVALIEEGADALAKTAYKTELQALNDQMLELTSTEAEYFEVMLKRKGITDETQIAALQTLRTQIQEKTKTRDVKDVIKGLNSEILSLTLSTVEYQKHLAKNVHKYAAEDVTRLTKAYKLLDDVQKAVALSEEALGIKQDLEARKAALGAENEKLQILNRLNTEKREIEKLFSDAVLATMDDDVAESIRKYIDDIKDSINYVDEHYSDIVFGELEKDLDDQLAAAKDLTGEYDMQKYVLQGVEDTQARQLMLIERQIDAYSELAAVMARIRDATKPDYTERHVAKLEKRAAPLLAEGAARKLGLEWRTLYGEDGEVLGQHVGAGNINLLDREFIDYAGGVASVGSMEVTSTTSHGVGYINIPTVIDGKVVSGDEAIEHYLETKEHLGRFVTQEAASESAKLTSQFMDNLYGLQTGTITSEVDEAYEDINAKTPKKIGGYLSDAIGRASAKSAEAQNIRSDYLEGKGIALDMLLDDEMIDFGIEQYNEMLDQIEEDTMERFANLDPDLAFLDYMEAAVKDIGVELAKMSFTELVDGFTEMGRGAQGFSETMGDVVLSIVDALPQLLLSAGLQLITAGNWGAGLALVAAAAVAGFAKGGLDSALNAPSIGSASGITLTKSAKGNLFRRGELLNAPTVFSTSTGLNLGGEQGTEAIMPLARTADGNLGVHVAGGMGKGEAQVTVNVINNSDNSTAEVQETTNADGTKSIDVVIRNVVNNQIARGSYDRALGHRYGVKNRGVM